MQEKNKKEIVCSNCSTINSSRNKFCESCGTKLKNEVPEIKVIFEDKKVIKNNKENSYSIIISIVITAVVCSLLSFLFFEFYFKNQTQTTINKDVTITDTGIASSVDKVMNSVVVVQTYQNNKLYSTGTGFVFQVDDTNGYILTNNHVVTNGNEFYIVFTNNEKVKVDLVGKDVYSDIAVLSVSKSKVLTVAEIGSSNDLRVGDTTFAVGAPLDSDTYSWTVTRGILSGKDRKVSVNLNTTGNSSVVMSVLQTDTAINSGNSGGPLCNANGEVIGITNMKISNTQVEGMGFAIPIETAIEFANKFINKEAIVRPYLGISMYDMENNAFSSSTGIYVSSVEENSAADKAGIQVGDIIVAIDGVNVSSSSYLKYELYKHKAGDIVTLTLTRNNKEITLKVKLDSNNSTT